MSGSNSHDLHEFMVQVSNEMASEYARIYARASEDPGTAGDEGEENWATLFREWLPPTYHVETKGRLIGHDGKMSGQIDVLVLKSSYPKKLLEKKVWLAGGVAAAFECKTTLTASHVKASVKRCAAFKDLYQPRVGTPYREMTSPLIYGLLAHSHSWKAENSTPIENIERALSEANQSEITHPRFELDCLCVADLATWAKSYITSYQASYKPESQQSLQDIFGGSCGPVTSLICSAMKADNQSPSFRPIGALIGHISERLAWSDPSVRDIADYYRKTNLLGSGQGEMRHWPLSVFSDDVRNRVLAGHLSHGVFWDEWSIVGP